MRLIRYAGYDFVFIDMEHTAYSFETVSDMCEMARAVGLIPVIRPWAADGELGNHIMDLGAMGLMQFGVTKRRQIEQFLDYMRYPPEGSRGQGFRNVFDYQASAGVESNKF